MTTAIALALLLLGAQPDFDVASVKPNHSGINGKGEGSDWEKITVSPGSVILSNVSLHSCLEWAYNLRDYQVVGPGWMDTERYDISAKAGAEATVPQMRQMMQRLLMERFGITSHLESREHPVYAMTVRKPGKLTRAAAAAEGDPSAGPAGGAMAFHNYSMAMLADRLRTRPFKLDRVVIDRTGLAGLYDFNIEFANDLAGLKHTLEGIELGSPGAPAMITVLEQQLGLSFKPQKAPVETLVVDHADKVPKGN